MKNTLDDVLVTYHRWLEEHYGVPPTVREMQDYFGMSSTSVAAYWLSKLEIAGFVMHAVPERIGGIAFRTNDLVLTDEGRWYAEAVMLREAVHG